MAGSTHLDVRPGLLAERLELIEQHTLRCVGHGLVWWEVGGVWWECGGSSGRVRGRVVVEVVVVVVVEPTFARTSKQYSLGGSGVGKAVEVMWRVVVM
jgi:hypothetical protein